MEQNEDATKEYNSFYLTETSKKPKLRESMAENVFTILKLSKGLFPLRVLHESREKERNASWMFFEGQALEGQPWVVVRAKALE